MPYILYLFKNLALIIVSASGSKTP